MNPSTRVFTWFFSVILALVVGWISGVTSASRFSASVSNVASTVILYFFAFVIIALAIGGAWAMMRDRRGLGRGVDRGATTSLKN